MAVLKDYRCLAHGTFESREAVCPHGCTTVMAVWNGKAPGGRSEKTKASDRAIQHLANRYGLTDMSNRGGESVGANRKQPNGMQPTWGELPSGNIFEAGKGEVNRTDRARVDSQGGAAAIGGPLSAGVSDIEKAIGTPLPNFMDLSKSMPKVRPIPAIRPHDGKFENSGDLDRAIASS